MLALYRKCLKERVWLHTHRTGPGKMEWQGVMAFRVLGLAGELTMEAGSFPVYGNSKLEQLNSSQGSATSQVSKQGTQLPFWVCFPIC